MGGGVSPNHKSSNIIELSRLAQDLFNWGWVGGWGWDVVTGSPTHVHMRMHACTHTHAHACTYDIIGNPRDFPKSNGGSHLHGIIMFTTHARVCVHAHPCAHV